MYREILYFLHENNMFSNKKDTFWHFPSYNNRFFIEKKWRIMPQIAGFRIENDIETPIYLLKIGYY